MSKNKLSVEPYKGVRYFYPEDQAFLNWLFKPIRAEVERAGYVEYHASVLEPAELYKAKGAENEEIINEQAYTFTDRGGREVALRPEMTPTVARMAAARRRELGSPPRPPARALAAQRRYLRLKELFRRCGSCRACLPHHDGAWRARERLQNPRRQPASYKHGSAGARTKRSADKTAV